MATVNVGAMAARLGLDPSEFLDKMKGVEGFTTASGQRIANEMKRTSREGAESFRLIDEALGIHISRPLTKLITQEFPALAKGLQAVLGVGAVGALGVAGFEFAEGISRKMEEAKKKEEEYADAVANTKKVVAEAAIESETRLDGILAKSAALAGDIGGAQRYKAMVAYAESVERTAKFVDALTEAERKEATAAAALMTNWAAIGSVWHTLFSTRQTLGLEGITDDLKAFKDKFDELAGMDALKGTKTSAKYLNDQMAEAKKTLEAMQAMQLSTTQQISGFIGRFIGNGPGPIGFSQQEIAAQADRLAKLQAMEDHGAQEAKTNAAQAQLDRAEDSARGLKLLETEQARLAEEARTLGKELHAALDRNDDISRLDNAFKGQMTTITSLRALLGGKGFYAEFGMGADEARQSLAKVTGELESQAQLKKFFDDTQTKKGAPRNLPVFDFTPATPTLANNGAVDGSLAALKEQPRKQQEMLAKAYAEALTPLQKFMIGQRELDELLKNADGSFKAGAEGAAAYAGAMRHLTEEEERELAVSRSASDGMRAFWLQLQIEGGKNGEFAFEMLNKSIHGVEDNLANAIVNGTRNWRQEWASLARELESSTLKFAFTKAFAGIGNQVMKSGGDSGGSGGATSGILASIIGLFNHSAGSTGTESYPKYADGGDVSPGKDFIAGEEGPELIRAGNSGANVTPNSKMGGETHIHNYDLRGAVVTDDLVRKADAARMVQASEDRGIARGQSMQRETALRSRPTR